MQVTPLVNSSIVSLIQAQARREVMASQTYRSLALWACMQSYEGSEKFLRCYSADELDHRDRWLEFMGGYVNVLPETPGFETIKLEPANLADCFAQALMMEQSQTTAISQIVQAADKANDQAVATFAQWFLKKQIRRVTKLLKITGMIAMASTDIAALMAVDCMIAKRC